MTTAHRDTDDGDDAERDERLLAALRHAPDAGVEPPPSLSTRILAQAQAATQMRGSRPWRERWGQAFGPRAPWAAAFGTIAVATLVGVLWSGREPAPVEDRAPLAPANAPAALENSKPEPAVPPSSVAPAPAGPAPATKPRAAPEPEAPAPARIEQRQHAAVPAAGAQARRAPPPADASPPPVPPTAEAPSEAAAGPARAERPPPSTDAKAARGDAMRVGVRAARSDPSTRLDAALAAPAPDAVVWRHAGRIHAHGGEQRLWWSQVGDATQGRWQAVTDVQGDLPPAWMVLSIGGERVAAFWFVGDMLWLRDTTGVWRVPVSSAQRRAWEAAAQRW
jgi:hypothetical protein